MRLASLTQEYPQRYSNILFCWMRSCLTSFPNPLPSLIYWKREGKKNKAQIFSKFFSSVCLLFSLWYSPANCQIGGTQHYGKRVIEMGKWCQAGILSKVLLLFVDFLLLSISKVFMKIILVVYTACYFCSLIL